MSTCLRISSISSSVSIPCGSWSALNLDEAQVALTADIVGLNPLWVMECAEPVMQETPNMEVPVSIPCGSWSALNLSRLWRKEEAIVGLNPLWVMECAEPLFLDFTTSEQRFFGSLRTSQFSAQLAALAKDSGRESPGP